MTGLDPRASEADGVATLRARAVVDAGRRLSGRVLETLFPPCCVLCRRSLEPGRPPLCAVCRHRLPRVPPPRCRRCGATDLLGGGAAVGCPACWAWPETLRSARSAYLMEEGAAEAVRALKYGGWSRLAEPMGRCMADEALDLACGGSGTPALVPVPLAPARLRERGFNQARLLARSLGAAVGWPVVEALARRPGGRRQASLSRSERLENVAGVFTPTEGPLAPDATAVIVDDVLTTGATAAACSSALEAGGWTAVGAVVFARALHPVA